MMDKARAAPRTQFRIMFDCIFLVSGVDSSHDRNAAVHPRHRLAGTRRAVLVMGLNRPDKRNAFNVAMLADLSRAYALLESDDSLRAGVLFAHGDDFTSGLDLVDVGRASRPDGSVSRRRSRPLTAGWRLDEARRRRRARLVPDTRHRIAAGRRHPDRCRRNAIRATGGAARIYPFGGATIRFPRQTGWGNAMRWCSPATSSTPTKRIASAWSRRSSTTAPRRWCGPARSPTPSPIAPPRSALRRSWRRRTWRVPRVTPPRSSGCAPK